MEECREQLDEAEQAAHFIRQRWQRLSAIGADCEYLCKAILKIMSV